MKKHLLVILGVLVLLLGVYIAGNDVLRHSSPKPAEQTAASHSAKPPATPAFNKAKYSLSDPTSLWVIVNKQRPLNPRDYTPPDLTPVGNGQYMRAEAATALAQMIAAAKTAGFTITPESGYRSYSTQVTTYNSEVKAFGQAQADSESARPGYSEHQTGWAIDLGSDGCNISDCFGSTPGGKWVAANAYKYGFLLRYPADKSDITGYRNETWHFRYIGIDLATQMHKEGITTLEEFFGLPAAPNY